MAKDAKFIISMVNPLNKNRFEMLNTVSEFVQVHLDAIELRKWQL